MHRVAAARKVGLTLMICLAASACPFPTQFQDPDPAPNLPPKIDAARTTPFYSGGNLDPGVKPQLTIWVNEPNTGDTLHVKVVQDLDDSIDPGSQIPHRILLTDAVIGPNDVPPPEEGEPESVRTKQFELQVTPCPSTAAGTTPVLTVCVADRDFSSYSDTNDPCQPSGRDAPELENRGYTVRYSVVYTCLEEEQ